MTNSSQTTPRVLCIGEAMLELSLSEFPDATLNFAGDTLNTAVYLKRLGKEKLDVAYCTVAGTDALSDELLSFIESEEIDVSTVRRATDRTIGLYAISTDDTGERSFTYWRNQSAARTLFESSESAEFISLAEYDVIYLSAITLAILPAAVRQQLQLEINRLRQQQKTLLAFDSNYRPALWESTAQAQSTIEAFWKITDIALPSIDDEQALFNDANEQEVIARFNTYGSMRGALKRGGTGPRNLQANNSNLPTTPSNLNIVDTTAAGDSFNAGYLYSLLTGQGESEALLQGHQCAMQVISQRGAIIPKSIWYS